MVKPKRTYKIKRIKKYLKKLEPTIVAKRFSEQIERLAELLKIWLAVQDWSEKETIEFLSSQGIPQDKFPFYLAFTKELINRALHFEITTMLNEMDLVIDTFEKRGLIKEILEALQQPQEKYGAIYSAFVSFLKNAYADYCFCDFCCCF